MKAGVEAGELRQVWVGEQQPLDGFERKRLVQRRERNVGFEIGEHASINTNGIGVLAAAVHHAVRHRRELALAKPGDHPLANALQRREVGVLRIQPKRLWRDAGFAIGWG